MALRHRNPQRGAVAGMLSRPGGFKHHEFPAVHPLANRLDIIQQRIGKAGQMQPDADPGMAFFQQDDRAQTSLLQT